MDERETIIHSLREKELIEAFSTVRTIATLYTQLVTILIIGNVTVIGFAISSHDLRYVCLGSAFPFMILVIRYACYMSMVPLGYFIYRFEKEFADSRHEFLVSTYINILDKEFATYFDNHINILEDDKRYEKLNKYIKKSILFIPENRLVSWLCILAFLIQIFFNFL